MPFSQSASFEGKKVLVTGGGRGLGRCAVKRFYDDGAIVYTVEKEQSLVDDLKKEFPKITAVKLDLTDLEKTKTVVESFGPLDCLVNNAGIYVAEKFMDITTQVMNRILDINLKSVIVVSQAVAKGMIANKSGGAIVNISSLAARVASSPGMGVYSCSKIAVTHLTKVMAIELGPHNIRVNCVAPGGCDTPTSLAPDSPVAKNMQEAVAHTASRCIIKRLVPPDEVVDLIFYLLSPLSAMVTGEEVAIDAGVTIT